MAEKRTPMPRKKVRLPVRFGEAGEKSNHLGYTDNVSPLGLFIITSRPADSGSHLVVDVDLPDGKGTIRLTGKVAWSRKVHMEIRSIQRPGFGLRLGVAPEAWYSFLASQD